jgi:hypothetical protein
MVELNGLDEIAEWLDQRELYGVATMLKRRADEESAEGPGPTTYLGMQVAAPVERGHERPVVTSADGIAFRWPGPAWSADPCGVEPPLNFSVDEVPPNCGGASRPTIAMENIADEPAAPLRDREVSVEAQVSVGQAGDADGRK